jgi:hypothetical protein
MIWWFAGHHNGVRQKLIYQAGAEMILLSFLISQTFCLLVLYINGSHIRDFTRKRWTSIWEEKKG